DAAALMAARWQASSLNLLGELNLLNALAIEARDDDAQDVITNMQARLCFAGPMTGVLAMQQAAKLNRIHVNEDFTEYMLEHAWTVRTEYGMDIGGHALFDEPWPGAWEDYADMIELVALEGVAAGVDNHKRYTDYADGHILTDKGFYRAVDGRDWCWFFLHYPGLLESHAGWHSWPPLPPLEPPVPQDCEYLALRVAQVLMAMWQAPLLEQQMNLLGYEPPPPFTTQLTYSVRNWMIYQPGPWGPWDAIQEDGFPVKGPPKPEFDVAGADVAVRVQSRVARLTPNLDNAAQEDEITWSAAAKPFGWVSSEEDGDRYPPSLWGFVLPSFHDVRLIPVDAASEGSPGGFDLAFHRHVRNHLPIYLATGRLEPGCRFCNSLGIFDDDDYRQQGRDWLAKHSNLCNLPPPGGGMPGGGTQHGH
ncbi:MAG: hypothetical protein FWF96_04295, partial [Kiritimatiellaeota bacterium]|nr:hypothetical protein [Kiritimatiellota bacterium]